MGSKKYIEFYVQYIKIIYFFPVLMYEYKQPISLFMYHEGKKPHRLGTT